MRAQIIFIGLLVLTSHQLIAQNLHKLTGPLGVYHISPGYCFHDTTGTDSIKIEDEFKFGEIFIPNQAADNGFAFQQDIDSCNQWSANKVIGIIQPPTEQGVINQPADTSLYFPYPQPNGPGMIQGGHRFSQLSQLYGSFCGVILDDWNGDTSIARQVRDAVRGKYVDANGNVFSGSVATTPNNKLYSVIYNTNANPSALPFIDGFSYWYVDAQNCCYTNLDNDINLLRTNFPRKEIMIGIYLSNTHLSWTDPASVQYMLEHSLNRYDDGDINGITIFAGTELLKSYMPLSEWKAFNLPHLLDSLYYPYLGEVKGKLIDCNSGNPLADAFITVYCKGRVSGDTLFRSRQKTEVNGNYQFGLWAGNRNTDSTYYWLVAEKPGYMIDTAHFWIKRNQSTNISDQSLCTTGIIEVNNTEDNIRIFPNPTSGIFTVEVGGEWRGELEIYNMLGEKVYSVIHPLAHNPIDLSSRPGGIYIGRLVGEQQITKEHVLMLQH